MIPTICADAIDLQNNLDSCRSDYGDEQINPDSRRGRFIAPTADLSACGGFLTIL